MSEESVFDPEAFLNGTIGGANSTKRLVVDAGTYPAFISDLKVERGTVKKEGANFGKPWTRLDVVWEIEDHALKAKMDRDKVTVFQGIMLEFDENGTLAMGKGKNVQLGRLREAIGLNEGPVAFHSFRGRPAMIKVDHEIYNNDPVERVTNVAKR